MNNNKYFGLWDDHYECKSLWGNPVDFPTEKQLLFASYGDNGYSGDALVVFKRGGKLYEVNGSHCSCNGLEDQWSPEETSWTVLAMRRLPEHETEACEALAKLCERKGQKQS